MSKLIRPVGRILPYLALGISEVDWDSVQEVVDCLTAKLISTVSILPCVLASTAKSQTASLSNIILLLI